MISHNKHFDKKSVAGAILHPPAQEGSIPATRQLSQLWLDTLSTANGVASRLGALRDDLTCHPVWLDAETGGLNEVIEALVQPTLIPLLSKKQRVV